MSRYTAITIIYNPNSTGSGKKLATELKRKLAKLIPDQPVELVFTQRAGHGEELAYNLALASKHPLIISASGDGGYHDVINGLVRAKATGANPVSGLLPAGNANDHFHSLHDQPIEDEITSGHEQSIDLLKLTATVDGKPFTRYAHSYIGIGLTPKVGQELNKTRLNWLNEILIVLRVLFLLQPVRVMISGKHQTFDSLIFSNIKKMSKVLSLSSDAKVDDGKFEVTAFHRRNKFALITKLLKASTTGLVGAEQTSNFEFVTLKPLLVQLDGEIITVDANTVVSILLQRAALSAVI